MGVDVSTHPLLHFAAFWFPFDGLLSKFLRVVEEVIANVRPGVSLLRPDTYSFMQDYPLTTHLMKRA
jgi:hypothetical protein